MAKGIYRFLNLVNGKSYIGQSTNIEGRKQAHLREYKNPNSHSYNSKFYRSLRKYGPDKYKFFILVSNDSFSKTDLNNLEIFYIQHFNSYKRGYNSTPGGDSFGFGISRELKLSEVRAIKKRILATNDTFESIASDYGVSSSLISMINTGMIWNNESGYSYPLRENDYRTNRGGSNSNAILTDEQVIAIRKEYVEKTLPEIYPSWQGTISFYELKKIVYGSQFKHIPIYKKREKRWELNGTRIDYPSL